MKKLFLIPLFLFLASASQAQEILGDWYGNLKAMGKEIPLIFHISKADNAYSATMDSPEQGAFGIPIPSVIFQNDSITMAIPLAAVVYDGNYLPDQKSIKGTFAQAGMAFPLDLFREKPVKKVNLHPQEPKPPFPYYTEEVKFTNKKDSISLAGTLSLPSQKGDFPAVILISGSGRQDRNSEILGHKSFLVISDYLTLNGIAVLRFDDRGVGESEGEFSTATTYDFASDVAAAVDYLKNRKEIDAEKIGLIGHSEGGIVAPIVANETDGIDFLVLLAGPALPGDELLLLQRQKFMEKMAADSLTVAEEQKIIEGAYEIVTSAEDISGIRQELETYFSGENGESLQEQERKALTASLSSPWMVYFLRYDPVPALENLDLPVLALFGENDMQVPPKINSERMKAALDKAGNEDYSVLVLDDLNHLFQESETGLPNEYAEIEQTFSPKALELILEWIKTHTEK